MSRELRKRGVLGEQISLFLGRHAKGYAATTSIYAPFEPEYCVQAVDAIEDVMAEVRKSLKVRSIDDPAQIFLETRHLSRNRAFLSEAKTEKLHRLILARQSVNELAQHFGCSTTTVGEVWWARQNPHIENLPN
jgi:hypothetical protein